MIYFFRFRNQCGSGKICCTHPKWEHYLENRHHILSKFVCFLSQLCCCIVHLWIKNFVANDQSILFHLNQIICSEFSVAYLFPYRLHRSPIWSFWGNECLYLWFLQFRHHYFLYRGCSGLLSIPVLSMNPAVYLHVIHMSNWLCHHTNSINHRLVLQHAPK